jgi:type II secretory pathway pseudopilin PulG
MKKKILIPIIILGLLLLGAIGYLFMQLNDQKQENAAMQELAELDKKEMENEYEQFARQYSEMKTQINNDSIVAQLTKEQLRTQELLKELQQVKATDAAEITRLKKELATCRAVIRSYVLEIDSLNRLNKNLQAENMMVKGQLEESTKQIDSLNANNEDLSQKVAIASQLDVNNLQMKLLDKRGKETPRLKKAKNLQVDFSLAKNVTAKNGQRTLYVRIQTPNGDVLTGGTFAYESKQIEYSMKKVVEYTGEETSVVTYWPVNEFLGAGDYRVSVFADGQMIGTRTFSFEK